MSALSEIQAKFQAYLMRAEEGIFTEAVAGGKVPLALRFHIYGEAYRLRLLDALAANYPVLQHFCGSEHFTKLGLHYLDAHPSTFRSIRWFGDGLAVFLNEHPDYQSHPYLAELAAFEWAMTESFDAADQETVDLSAVLSLAPEAWAEMCLSAHPSTRFLHFSWNVVAIWQALSQEKPAPVPQQSEKPGAWLLWRHHLTNQFCALPADEAAALQALLQGKTFGELCEILYQQDEDPQAPMKAASFLKGWLASGLIVKVMTRS